MLTKAINYWSFPGGLEGAKPIIEALREARAAGYEALEPALAEGGELGLETDEASVRAIARMADAEGVRIQSVATGLLWAWPLTSNDPAVRARGLAICRKLIDAAAWLGAGAVLVIPGAVDVFFRPGAPVTPYADVYERAIDAIGELEPYARERSVAIGLENVWNRFLMEPSSMCSFIDLFDSPWVGAYLDTGNCTAFGYAEHWIRMLDHRLKRVHFKDYRRDAGGASGFVDLLAGDVNWPEVVAALDEVGYDGPVTAEMIPGYKHYPEVLIQNTSRAMDAILGR
jgi:hexulose-6-phosphate isomerase